MDEWTLYDSDNPATWPPQNGKLVLVYDTCAGWQYGRMITGTLHVRGPKLPSASFKHRTFWKPTGALPAAAFPASV